MHHPGALMSEVFQTKQETPYDKGSRIRVPTGRVWQLRPDLKNRTVIPHTCYAKEHGNHNVCICSLIGQPITIEGICSSTHTGIPTYSIKGTTKRIQEREFSGDTLGIDTTRQKGYILENGEGEYLSPAFVWMPKHMLQGGYVHDIQTVRILKRLGFPCGAPQYAYPASVTCDGEDLVIGSQVPFSQLELE